MKEESKFDGRKHDWIKFDEAAEWQDNADDKMDITYRKMLKAIIKNKDSVYQFMHATGALRVSLQYKRHIVRGKQIPVIVEQYRWYHPFTIIAVVVCFFAMCIEGLVRSILDTMKLFEREERELL